MPLLDVNNLTKRFGDLLVVDGISFQLERGEILGLLGPNGAGKTTPSRCCSASSRRRAAGSGSSISTSRAIVKPFSKG